MIGVPDFDLRPLMYLAVVGLIALIVGVPTLIYWLVTHVSVTWR